MKKITLNVNGEDITLEVKRNWTLLYVLREILGLTGAKPGCNTGDCGACKVIIDGKAVNSCLIHAVKVQARLLKRWKVYLQMETSPIAAGIYRLWCCSVRLLYTWHANEC
jgi:succinate dehydrogenase/fumarate reductase-like Fe-S protein